MFLSRLLLTLTLLTPLAACKVEPDYPTRSKDLYKFGSVTGSQGIALTGKTQTERSDPQNATNVNKYLWHGALETLSFAPLSSVDVRSGVILTEWYQLEGVRGEQYKTTVHIKSKELRADALHVQTHKKIRTQAGWVQKAVSPQVVDKLENAILAQAKKLRNKERNS